MSKHAGSRLAFASFLACLGTIGLAGSGCATTPSGSSSIAWHEGDVEGAFRLAVQQDKPLFLYWGAVWCPPCQQVKTTIFSRPEFIEKSRAFIPVYLDGDTESAQTWGEHFEVMGYPTMIIFDPAGGEITRIPGGIDIQAYAGVLDVALRRMRPVDDVLRAVLDGEDVADEDFHLLAYHSWGQDQDIGVPDEDRVEAFRALARSVPEHLPLERSRLFLTYLSRAVRADGRSEDEREAAVERLLRLLDDDALLRANLGFFEFEASPVIDELLPEDSPRRQELIDRWLDAMDAVAQDEDLTTDQRLNALRPALEIHAMASADEDTPPDEDLLQRIRQTVAWADEVTLDPAARQSTINTAAHLLNNAGLKEEARELLTAELERSQAPYYFMGWLADLAADAGRDEEAIEWLRKAHEASEGRATRFQWGVDYLSGLLELTPDDAERIAREADRVLSELLTQKDAFHGRNRSRLDRLESRLLAWNATGEHDTVIAGIRDVVRGSCDRIEDGRAQERCTGFLSEG